MLVCNYVPLQGEDDYDRWQLLPRPITLDEFNVKPHLSPAFFELGMELVGEIPTTPWEVQDQAVLMIKAWEVIRYKVSPAMCTSIHSRPAVQTVARGGGGVGGPQQLHHVPPGGRGQGRGRLHHSPARPGRLLSKVRRSQAPYFFFK